MPTGQPNFDSYKKAVEFLESFSNSSIRKADASVTGSPKNLNFYVDRTKYFLGLLGNPEDGFKYIHITGTAGKGSVSTMLHDILVQSGKKAGIFTSPYVTTTIEQIKVSELFIAPDEFADIVESLKPYIKQAKESSFGIPSAFELLFVVSILYFKRQQCEWVVLEVGMGGRYDATNVIKKTEVAAITNIGLDHTDILGKTVEEIAYDKMGIIKPGCAFFTSEQRPELQKMFEECCKSLDAKYSSISRQKSYSAYNAELVRAICRHLKIEEKYVERGITHLQLPCRFEIMQVAPCIVLDGAHNKPKTASTIANLNKLDFDKLFLVLTVSDTKDEKTDIVQPLMTTGHETHAYICQISANERKSVSPNFLLPIAQQYLKEGGTVEIIENPQDALDAAIAKAGKNDLILVTGSFFLAGELRKRWIPEKWVLENRRSFR